MLTGRFLGLELAKHRPAAEAHYRTMRERSGSEQIASPFAIGVLMALLEKIQPARVLEVGAGIGTMTAVLTRACKLVYAVEDNTFCQAEMIRNPMIVKSHLGLGLGYLHHLAVVDGDQVAPGKVLEMLRRGGFIFVEGGRRGWRAKLKYSYRPFAAVELRPFDRSKGVWLYAFEPDPRTRLAFALERGWQAVLTFTSRAWSLLTGARYYHGKRREENVGHA